MKAMILAAGEGRRMLPLTLTRPKPLLKIGSHTLIEHQIVRLRQAGITEIVINVAYLGAQIMDSLGDGARYGVSLEYSIEPTPLETGGALHYALPALEESPFILVNADVWCDYDFSYLTEKCKILERAQDPYVHLVLVSNPEHNPEGDYVLDRSVTPMRVCARPQKTCDADHQMSKGLMSKGLTFSGLSVIHPALIQDYPNTRECFPLKEAFDWAIQKERITGEHYQGVWSDIGTPERLNSLRSEYHL